MKPLDFMIYVLMFVACYVLGTIVMTILAFFAIRNGWI